MFEHNVPNLVKSSRVYQNTVHCICDSAYSVPTPRYIAICIQIHELALDSYNCYLKKSVTINHLYSHVYLNS